MKERPILFSAPMVRAILAGRKTVTRRIVKPQPEVDGLFEQGIKLAIPKRLLGKGELAGYSAPSRAIRDGVCQYGQPGDRLWVRETWQGPLFDYDQWDSYREDHRRFETPAFCRYAADGGSPPEFVDDEDNLQCKWRPSIHMPRWASRITLEVTGVRVERLQEISEADAIAEGAERPENALDIDVWDGVERAAFNAMNQPADQFRRLWEQINGAASWEANPWVWVVAFRRIEQESAR